MARSFILLCIAALAGCASGNREDSRPQPTQPKQRSITLQQRAKDFLSRPIPKGMPYVPDSISERFIAEYASQGRTHLDPERLELLQICVFEGENAVTENTGAEREYFAESTAILRGILAEANEARLKR